MEATKTKFATKRLDREIVAVPLTVGMKVKVMRGGFRPGIHDFSTMVGEVVSTNARFDYSGVTVQFDHPGCRGVRLVTDACFLVAA